MSDSPDLALTHLTADREAWAPLDAAFDLAIAPWRAGAGPLAVLFSGGVDSGLLAWELRNRPSTVLCTVGTPGSPDLVAAGPAARAIGLPWVPCELSDEQLAGIRSRAGAELSAVPPPRRSLFFALAAVTELAAAPELVCGQGADELFLGYYHFRGLGAEAARERAAADLAQLLSDDWPRTVRLAALAGRRLGAPFLDPGFVRASLAVPIELRMPGAAPKRLFRAWARQRGLPAEIAERPKRALQFGSGVDAWWRRERTP